MASEMASEIVGMEQLLESVNALGAEELVLIIEAASTRLKKLGTKRLPKGKRISTGEVPSQLQQNYEWVSFVLADARLNGWEAFTIKRIQTDKATGIKTEVETDMAGSVECEDGSFVYSDTNEVFTHGHAMSYSKMLKERNDPLYQQFLEAFQEQMGPLREVAPGAKVVKISAAEAAAEKKRKDEEKAMEKAAEKAQKEAEKARAKAAKEAEKEAEKERKAAEKAAKAKPVVQKAAPLVQPVKRLPSPVPAPVVDAAAAALPMNVAAVVSPAKVIAKKPGAPVKAKVVDPWSCEEGEMDVWEWKGEKYIRDYNNYVWQEVDGGQGIFLGMYIFAKDAIEEAEEPVYDE
jgi:hypothetical protein